MAANEERAKERDREREERAKERDREREERNERAKARHHEVMTAIEKYASMYDERFKSSPSLSCAAQARRGRAP